MNEITTKAWRQYEAGCDYKRRIGLYETVNTNERFLRGDQWNGGAHNLPKPVFNVLRRTVDYIVSTVFSKKTSIVYSAEDIPYSTDPAAAEKLRDSAELLGKSAAYRWENCKMDKLMKGALYDAAISGDGVIYSYFDPNAATAQPYKGDIKAELIDNVNLFVADVNRADIQSQEYIIIAGRQSVTSLKREAIKAGMAKKDAERLILPGTETQTLSGDMAKCELDGEDEAKATYLIKFWRDEGSVIFEKSVKNCVIKRVNTGLRLYPVAYFNWYPTKNSFHGTSPITGLIPNQKFINLGYAMVMKHMTDTAFSKVVYDRSKIPEWTNEVGEAIAAVGTANVSDAVSIIEPGKLEDGYLDLLDGTVKLTKEMMGATEAALGNLNPTNTSAIIAVQEASKVPLLCIKDNLHQCIEDIANIWADMMCNYYPAGRLLPYSDGGVTAVGKADLSLLRDALLTARVEIADPERYSLAYNMSVLDRLLDGGYITFEEYLERIPQGIVVGKDALIEKRRKEREQNGNRNQM